MYFEFQMEKFKTFVRYEKSVDKIETDLALDSYRIFRAVLVVKSAYIYKKKSTDVYLWYETADLFSTKYLRKKIIKNFKSSKILKSYFEIEESK